MDIIACLKQNVDMKQIRIKKETREPILEGLPLLFGDMDKKLPGRKPSASKRKRAAR